MINLSLFLVLVAFALSFVHLRRAKMWIRVSAGALLTCLLVGLFVALVVLGGDPATPDSSTHTVTK
jgi:lipopolysaccharide export LptBFGC system permease protein LptF